MKGISNMVGLLHGHSALITGAASGIGHAAALLFAAEGARVAVGDLDQVGGENTVAEIEAAGGEAFYGYIDVSDEVSARAFVETVVDRFGRLDCAFNNAGVAGVPGSVADYPLADWERMLKVNLTGPFNCMKAELEIMLEQGSGSIVNTASNAGLRGQPRLPGYVASKHGVVGLSKQAAVDYATRGIRVNALCPGPTMTTLVERWLETIDEPAEEALAWWISKIPMGRYGRPAEIAEAALWLCSDRSSFVNGHALAVDGGWTAA